MSTHPRNVIILHSDEMRADCTGFGGSTDAHTPELDAFARQATVLNQHFTVHGKCVPSRVAMMTGRYAHSDGIRTVKEENLLPSCHPDLMKFLKIQGYETAVFGHNHCWSDFFNNNKPHGTVDWHSFVEGDFSQITHSDRPVPPPLHRKDVPDLNDGYDMLGRRTSALGKFSDDTKVECAIHFLERVRDRKKPFFMQLNIGAPHPPYQVEEPWFSMFDPAKLSIFPTDLPRHATLPLRAQRRHRTGDGPVPESAVREVLATYLGMIAKVDMLIGRVLDSVRAQGLMDDSLVIFTSDHGDFAGQYGLCEKFDTVLADCLLHVPCILHIPGQPGGRRIEALTQHIDLPPTILDLLGFVPGENWNMHGSTLVPVLAEKCRPQYIFADGGHEAPMRRRFNASLWSGQPPQHMATAGKQHTYHNEPDSMARCSMVRSETHKLVVREIGGNELYDMRADPWELDNRYGDPALASIQAQLMERLARWHLETLPDNPFQPSVGA
jgi:arylsulfatase A-like enzyme